MLIEIERDQCTTALGGKASPKEGKSSLYASLFWVNFNFFIPVSFTTERKINGFRLNDKLLP